MPPKARPTPAKGAVTPPATPPPPLFPAAVVAAKDTADPMLQGNYEHDDDTDFDPASDAIAAFEARLQEQHRAGSSRLAHTPPPSPPQVSSSGGRSTSLFAMRASPRHRRMQSQQEQPSHANAGDQRRLSSLARGAPPQRTPAPLLATSPTPTYTAAAHRAADRRLSEEEQAAQIQRGEDVEDVRLLEDHFGGADDADDNDSDDGVAALRRKTGL